MPTAREPKFFHEIAKRLGVKEEEVIFKGFGKRDRLVFICPEPDDFRWRKLPKDLIKRVPETEFNICTTITLQGVSLPPAICDQLRTEHAALLNALSDAVANADWDLVIEISNDLQRVEMRLELCKPRTRTITVCVFPRLP